jgi:hypothetical protein
MPKFARDWVYNNLDLKRAGDRYPKPEGLERIGAKLEQVLIDEINSVPAVDPFTPQLPPNAHGPLRVGYVLYKEKGGERPWHRWVSPLAEMVLEEVKKANPRSFDKNPNYYSYSADGSIARFMVKVIKEIDGEDVTVAAVARFLERHRSK